MQMEITEGGWLATTLALAGGYVVRIFFDRRKLKAENSSAELDADTKAVELYERYAASLTPKIETLEQKQVELSNAIAELKVENTNLRIENAELKAENSRLKLDIQVMHTQIGELQQTVENTKPRTRGTKHS